MSSLKREKKTKSSLTPQNSINFNIFFLFPFIISTDEKWRSRCFVQNSICRESIWVKVNAISVKQRDEGFGPKNNKIFPFHM